MVDLRCYPHQRLTYLLHEAEFEYKVLRKISGLKREGKRGNRYYHGDQTSVDEVGEARSMYRKDVK